MSESATSKWSLKIPFTAAPGFPLKEANDLVVQQYKFRLTPGGLDYTNVVIEGLESERAALEMFEAVRTGLFAASLNLHCGVRIEDAVEVLQLDSPMPERAGVPIIYPTGKDLRRLLVGRVTIQMQVDKILPTIASSLAFGITSKQARLAMTDPRIRLALELYVDTYFEVSDSARFIALVSVLEVLKDKNSTSDAVFALVDSWCKEASAQLEKDEAESIVGTLRHLRSISISRGITAVVKRHLDQPRAVEAKRIYTARSSLVHDGIRPSNFAEILTSTQQLVIDLLARILSSGSLKP